MGSEISKQNIYIQQGETGDFFFMVEEGELSAHIIGEDKSIMSYKAGMYFGELALLKDQPRAASILCNTDCNLMALDRYTFKRLLGPVEEILKRNAENYDKYGR